MPKPNTQDYRNLVLAKFPRAKCVPQEIWPEVGKPGEPGYRGDQPTWGIFLEPGSSDRVGWANSPLGAWKDAYERLASEGRI